MSALGLKNFLKHVYDPSDEDIRRMFPTYQPWTKQQWLSAYNQDGTQTAAEIAAFALSKLDLVTTSYRLDNAQREDLERLSRGESTQHGLFGFEGYCTTLHARQMGYVGW